jgi:Ni,Fe-hydrogenase III large subunit
MSAAAFISLRNGASLAWSAVPELVWKDFEARMRQHLGQGLRVCSYFCVAPPKASKATLLAILADDLNGQLLVARTRVGTSFPSLAADFPQLQLFEREIAEQYGLKPEGHPWLKPVRFAPALGGPGTGKGRSKTPRIGAMEFYRVEGEEVHEVAVGPVHAGVIEPGHFRFQCHGEEVLNLEISLGYQHRGVEQALLHGPDKRSPHLAETLAGDSSVGHAWAYSAVVEALAGIEAPARGQALAALALELERLANHVGDLGAMAGDVGYLPTSSYCGRLRGDFLNMSALLCGNRFGRGMLRPGGAGFDLDAARMDELLARLERAGKELQSAVPLLWDSASVMARFEGAGRLSREQALELGLVGPAARACGLERDARLDHPLGYYRFSHIPLSSADSGDVWARAYVRWLEIERSLRFLRELGRSLPQGPALRAPRALKPGRLAVCLVEGWRGEICHAAISDAQGRFLRYKVVDPSFHNWPGLSLAMRRRRISDFPLCNKSFNLSYCGHDL